MFQNILFPVDFSDRSRGAAPFVLSMAQRHGSKVVLIHAFEPPPPVYAGMYGVYPETFDFASVQGDLKVKLTEFAERELPGVSCSRVVETGNAAVVIIEYAEANGITLIAMPTHGYGIFRRTLLGSVTARVLHDAKVPVWTDAHVADPSHRAHPEPRRIVAALDLKPDNAHILNTALQLAKETGAKLELVHASPASDIPLPESDGRVWELLAQDARDHLVRMCQNAGTDAEITIGQGSVADVVRQTALAQRSDLIVIGRGRIQGGLSRLAANAYAVVREAPCPVLSL